MKREQRKPLGLIEERPTYSSAEEEKAALRQMSLGLARIGEKHALQRKYGVSVSIEEFVP